jgi:hypothetical protein
MSDCRPCRRFTEARSEIPKWHRDDAPSLSRLDVQTQRVQDGIDKLAPLTPN